MAGLTFARLPDETNEFIEYLQSTGDIWARATADDPLTPRWPPQPIADFILAFSEEIREYAVVKLYFGNRTNVLNPAVYDYEITEGGTAVPLVRDGVEVPGATVRIGGHKVPGRAVHSRNSPLVSYTLGDFRSQDEVAISHLSFHSGYYDHARLYRQHPEPFVRWATNVLNWMRRRTTHQVAVYRANYEVRATEKALSAWRDGMRFR